MKKVFLLVVLCLLSIGAPAFQAQEGLIPFFKLETGDLKLERLAQPRTYFDKVGRKFAILGLERGSFEAWAYPLKLFRNFEFSFLLGSSAVPIEGKDTARYITVTPEVTTITFTSQSFTIQANYIAAIDDPGALILLEVDAVEPLSIICSFIPVLQPMWPAGIGGQYASWDESLKAYLISEPTRKNHGLIGSPAARGISYTPAHMLSDSPSQFIIEIKNIDAVKGKYIPIIMAGGKGPRDEVRKIYERLAANPESYYRASKDHYRDLRASSLQVKTPEVNLNVAFEWAKIAYDNLFVDNPDLGRGLVAGLGRSGSGGRPGFGWFFGTDAYLNSLSLDSLGLHSMARDVLAFTQKWQRSDGKMAHELSQAAGYLRWFEDYPYGYIHAETTPFYIEAVYEYYKKSGDIEFIKKSWPSLKRAFAWCLTTDVDGDGLMDNKKAGLGALEFGSLTGIQTDIYLAAVWARAAYAMRELAQGAGDTAQAKEAGEHFVRARQAFDSKFWDSELGQYSYAFTGDGKKVKDLSPWSAVGLSWGLGDPERSARALEKLGSAEITTDWGIRILSTKSGLFEPLNYNYGAVWPFLSGWTATAQFKQGFAIQGYESLMSSVRHTFDNAAGNVTELFSGAQNIWPEEAVPHQGFSTASVVLPVVGGLFGLEGSALEKRITFEPRFPADWEKASVEKYRVGDADFSFHWRRKERSLQVEVISTKNEGWSLVFGPALGPGTKILAVRVNGQPVRFKLEESTLSSAVQPVLEIVLTGKDMIEIDFEPTVEILPPAIVTKTGDPDNGLKIIKLERSEKQLKLTLEGLAREHYALGLTHSELVASVQGAKLESGRLLIAFPEGPPGQFIRLELQIKVKIG